MSLYYESASIINGADKKSSLKSLVFSENKFKSKPAHIFALVAEAVKWSDILSTIINKSDILKHERKLTPALALLLTHDLLLSRSGVAAPKNHVLRVSIEKHKSRLAAEFTKARVKAGFATLQSWREAVDAHDDLGSEPETNGQRPRFKHPRWVRINTLQSSLEQELRDTFEEYQISESLVDVLRAAPTRRIIAIDEHVPNLCAIPAGTDLTRSNAYIQGRIIFQDKASCFPSLLLDPQTSDGDILDACAAPGNKTTHLLALMSQALEHSHNHPQTRTVFACERDSNRAATLQKMLNKALGQGVHRCQVRTLANQDFLKLDPNDTKFHRVGAVLLDPSCSGSGIVGRDNSELIPNHQLVLPQSTNEAILSNQKGRKRKRSGTRLELSDSKVSSLSTDSEEGVHDESESTALSKPDSSRLQSLAKFQISMIQHAFRFPSANKVVYSTCSLYAEENEHVVIQVLNSEASRDLGWRLCTRAEQTENLRKWGKRGDLVSVSHILQNPGVHSAEGLDAKTIAEACIRCEKDTDDGTMGFFAVMFLRDKQGQTSYPIVQVQISNEEDEWSGFSGEEE